MRFYALLMIALSALRISVDSVVLAQVTPEIQSVYGRTGVVLSEAYDSHLKQRDVIRKSFFQVKQDLAWVERDLGELQSKTVEKMMEMLESEIFQKSILQEYPTLLTRTPTWGKQKEEYNENLASRILTQELVNQSAIELQLKVNQSATKTAEERKNRLVAELELLQKHSQQWDVNDVKLFVEYLMASDISHTRSATELEEFLEAISVQPSSDKETPINYGAKLARIITLVRLERSHETIEELEELMKLPSIIGSLAKAIHAEALLRTGAPLKKVEGELSEALKISQENPFVIMMVAQVYAYEKEYGKAAKLWEKLRSNPTFEIAARRNIALALTSLEHLSRENANRSLTEAKLASGLSGGTDWASLVAYSIALSKTASKAEALTQAKQAELLAIAENKRICSKLIKAIEIDAPIRWDF